ncbi:hypothetical protein CK203_106907 [Vitis vinifera]|uniref:Uncharacterized protein n=1 Tax=Vitis vinifera TaxID=29760 RepID=A0A438C6N4_VITVI|nr:hypothetical protein CK203_106907 [Vitis vinifera]
MFRPQSPVCPTGQRLSPECLPFSHCYSPWFRAFRFWSFYLDSQGVMIAPKREVMGTLMIDLQIGPATFSTLFQVLRIPTSFNLLLGRPWIHVAGAIPSSLHQKVKFIHDGQTLEIEDFHRDFVAMSFDQHSSTVVLDMMRGMTFLPGMGLGRRQQGPSEFIACH